MNYRLLSVKAKESDNLLIRVISLPGDDTKGKTRRVLCAREDYLSIGSPAEGTILYPEDVAVLFRKGDRTAAVERAYMILSSSDNSASALHRKLCERGFLAESAGYAVEYMKKNGYLDEEDACRRYTEQWAEKRLFGKRRILDGLLRKGYPREIAVRAICEAEESGAVDFSQARDRFLAQLPPDTPEEKRRSLLYKNGF